MPRAEIFFVRVGPYEVEVQLLTGHFGEELSTRSELFEDEELVFLQAMNRFHVALIGVCGRRDAHVLAVAESFWEVAFAFPAVVGLPEQIAERDAATLQKLLDARGEDRASSGAAFFGESPEP